MMEADACWLAILTTADFLPCDIGRVCDSHIVPGFKEETLIEQGLDLDTRLGFFQRWFW